MITRKTNTPFAKRADQGGTTGFPGELSGQSIEGTYNTSSFDARQEEYEESRKSLNPGTGTGLEEGGRKRLPTTSSAGKILEPK